jgi:hypothetical protein
MFVIEWMTFNGSWRVTPGPVYASRKAAVAALRLLGLTGNPAYRVVEG